MTGEYQYQDGWPLTFTSWGMDKPSGEGCTVLTSDETWHDTDCAEMKPFICRQTLGKSNMEFHRCKIDVWSRYHFIWDKERYWGVNWENMEVYNRMIIASP